MLSDVFEEYGHFLFCIGESASAIFWENNTYYIYDPHSRNKHGFPDADTTSVRLKFNSIEKMHNYVANLAIGLNTYEFELTPLQIVMHVPDDYMNVRIKKKRIDFENSEHSHLQYRKPYHVQVFSRIDEIGRQKNREYMRRYRAQKKQNVNNKQHQTQHITDPVKSTSLTRKTEAKRLKHLHVTLQQDKITEEISPDAPVSTRNEKKLKNKQHYMRNYWARQLIQTTPQNQQITTYKGNHITETTNSKLFNYTYRQKELHMERRIIAERNCGKDLDQTIKTFHKMIQDGCIFPCSVFQQTNFPEQVIPVTNLHPGAHQVLLNECLAGYKLLDDIEYICLPCKNTIYRGQVPRLSIINKCGFPQQPPELLLFPLEERLISPIIPFMNVREHPVGAQKAIYGSICHVPVDVAPTVSSLPCNMQETDTISVKIKCKHSYKHHVLAENIRPRKVLEALHYLLQNSTMFQNENIQINADWLTKLLTDESNAPSSVTHDVSETAPIQVTQDQMEMTQSDVTSSSTVDTTDAVSMLPVEDEDGDDNDDQEQEEDDEPVNAPSTNTNVT